MTTRRSAFSIILAHLPALIFAFAMGYPVLWMIFNSLKTQNEIYTNIWGPPATPRWTNYIQAWETADAGTLFRNSAIITVASVGLIVILATVASFAFAKVRFRGSRLVFLLFIATMLVPQQVLIIPLFRLVKSLQIIDTHLSLILPYVAGGLPLAVFILTTYFQSIPDELVEAARIDGCGNMQILRRIILPISGPAISAVVIFEFLEVWNEFFLALVFIQKSDLRTLPLGLFSFSSRFITDYSLLFAVLSLAMLPVVAVFLIFQKRFVSGLTAGALVE